MGSGESKLSAEERRDRNRIHHGILPSHLGGGPHGLGDPNDHTLRVIEEKEIIPQRMREIIKATKCTDISDVLGGCIKQHQLLFAISCKKQNEDLKECIRFWNENADFQKAVTDQYLADRAIYRATGKTEQKRELEAQLEKSHQKAALKPKSYSFVDEN